MKTLLILSLITAVLLWYALQGREWLKSKPWAIKAKISALRERLTGWKTIIWNVFLGVAPAAAVALQQFGAIDWSQYVGPLGAVGIGFLVSSVGIWLRYITTGPVGAKGDEQPDPDVKAGD